jgi:hypothetical protein
MASIAPKVCRTAPAFGKLSRATPRSIAGYVVARATAALSSKTPYTSSPQASYTSSQAPRSDNQAPLSTPKSSPKGILPEFDLNGKVIVVSGGAQGLGLVQAEALLEAGAIG